MAAETGFRVATGYVAVVPADEDFQGQLEAMISDACANAGALGGDIFARSMAAALAGGGDELRGALEESVSGAGDAMASEIGAQLAQGLAGEAQIAADELRGALEESTGGVGDVVAEQVASQLVSGLADTGVAAGHEISAGIENSLSATGVHAAGEIAAGLTAAAAPIGPAVGAEIGAGLSATLPLAARAAAAQLGDAIVEGGGSIGDQLAALISEQLRLGLDDQAQAATALLGEVMVESAAGIGDTLAAQIGEEMQSAVASAGEVAGEALKEAILEGAAGAGDALGAEIGAGLETSVAAGSGGGAAAIEHAMQEVAVVLEQEGEDAGIRYVAGLQKGLSTANAAWGARPIEELLSSGARPDEFVQDPNDPFRTVLQSVADREAQAKSAAAAIASAEGDALQGTQAALTYLDGLFEQIMQGGQGMSVQLAASMVDAFQGIEVNTAEFTSSELAIFERFFATLEAEGEQAALAVATQMRLVSKEAVSGMDFMQAGLTTFGQPIEEAGAAAAGATEKVGAAAKGATGALGGMAGMMGGPWLWGVMGVATMLPFVLPMLTQWTQSLADGGYTAQVAALAAQGLGTAVSQDSGFLGDNTAATIQNILVKSNLNDMAGKLGVSQATLIEYAAGESAAQGAVSDAYQKTQDSVTAYIGIRNASTEAQITANMQLRDEKKALDELAASVVQSINADRDQSQALLAADQTTQIYTASIEALVAKQRLQAEQSRMTADATGAYLMTLIPGSREYTNAIDDQVIALRQSAVTAQINAEALNRSLPPQAQLSTEAVDAATAYQQASTATGAYTNALSALYGQYGQASGAEAAFTTAVDGLNGKITSGTDAVALNTAAGAKNFTAFQQVAAAAETYAEKLYQQTGSSQAADTALQTMVGKLDDAARQAHLTTDQINQLNTELFGIPDVKNIQIHLDPTPAEQQMSALSGFIQGEIDSLNAQPINLFLQGEVAGVNGTPPNLVGGGHARAAGGPVQAGQAYIVGEQRAEVFVPQSDGYIYPSLDEGRHAVASSGVTVHQHFYGTQWPTAEQTAVMHRELAFAVGAI